MNLADLQRAFQQHILAGDPRTDAPASPIAAQIRPSADVPVGARLDVYASAYGLRLTEALAHNFPRLQQLIGEDAFAALGADYLRIHPSQNVSVRWLGDCLADFLRATYPLQPVLADLAEWEWAIAAAFDAPDRDVLTERMLSEIDPSQWVALPLQMHPSVHCLRMGTNAALIFKALTAEELPPEPRTVQPQHWVLWRQELAPHYRSVAADEAAALQVMVAGTTFDRLCEALCDWHDASDVPTRAVVLLKGWLRDEMILKPDGFG